MTKNEILNILTKNKSYLEKTFEVSKIGLFGSYVKDLQTSESDIDIYVEFKHKTFDNLSGLWVYLEDLYHQKVDLLHKHKGNQGAIYESIKKEVIYG